MGHGSVLAGRYRLDERVRTRPDGSMWRAVDETLERPVLVQAFALGHPQASEIVDAARRAALVPDPRLQRVLAAGEERGTAYVVLERVPGRTLEELLGAGPLPAETARRIVGEAAQALDRASTRGLHHLKLRPGTIIVGRDGVVTVSGTAIDAAAAGTEPPNTAVARRVDAVGLVTVLYAALTGRWPGRQEGRLPRAPRIGGRPVAPGDLVAGVPNDLDTLCAVTLGPYDDGPRTPSDLAAELAPWAPPGPLTDPRGLHIAIPRPDASGSARVVPATPDADRDEARPGAPHAPGRTPAWGLRAARLRSRAASGTAVAASVAEAGDAETPDAAGAAAAPTGDRRPGIRSWATVEELRAALRSSTRGVAGGHRVPLAETPPPVGAPLTWWTPPAGAPSETTPPAGGPLAPAVPPSVPVAGPPAPPAPPAPSVAAPAPEAAGSPRPSTAPPTGPSGPSARTAPSSAVVDADLRPGEPRPRARPRHSDVAAAAAASGEPRAQARVDSGAPPPAEPWTAAPTVSRRDAGADSPRESRPAPSPPSSPPSSPPPGSGRGPGVETSPPPARRRRRPPVAARPRSPGPELLTGVEALDILGAAARPVEPVAPFGPATPVTRPPREQSRLVVLVLATLVFILGGFAVTRFLTFDAAPLITQDGGAPA
ncbi:MAG: hypothetical protein ACXV3A_09040, partial [Kineosporiaceae bacterium]